MDRKMDMARLYLDLGFCCGWEVIGCKMGFGNCLSGIVHLETLRLYWLCLSWGK